jgi:hypothetical protein
VARVPVCGLVEHDEHPAPDVGRTGAGLPVRSSSIPNDTEARGCRAVTTESATIVCRAQQPNW